MVFEQLLALLVGLADTLMIAHDGVHRFHVGLPPGMRISAGNLFRLGIVGCVDGNG